jgi:hypothetical protein
MVADTGQLIILAIQPLQHQLMAVVIAAATTTVIHDRQRQHMEADLAQQIITGLRRQLLQPMVEDIDQPTAMEKP